MKDILAKMPSIGYDLESVRIKSIENSEGSPTPCIYVTTVETENSGYLRSKFGGHVYQTLKSTNSGLTFETYDVPEGIFILGFRRYSTPDGESTRSREVKVVIKSGKDKERDVIVNPVVHSNGFLEDYKEVLERDLVGNSTE